MGETVKWQGEDLQLRTSNNSTKGLAIRVFYVDA